MQRPGVELASGLTEHRYGDDPSQVADLHRPAWSGSAPVVVVLHGGFWRDRYDRHLMDRVCADLAHRGAYAWNLEYRRLGSGGGYPETFADVAAGIDELGRLAEGGEPLDLARVAAVGHSAGGHLALWATARERLPPWAPGAAPRVRIGRVVSQAGVADVAEASRLRLSDGVADQLLGTPAEAAAERLAVASPRALVPLGVPQLLVHGTDDDSVPLEISEGYAAAAREAGDAVELVILPGAGHFEHIDPGEQAWRVAADWLLRGWI